MNFRSDVPTISIWLVILHAVVFHVNTNSYSFVLIFSKIALRSYFSCQNSAFFPFFVILQVSIPHNRISINILLYIITIIPLLFDFSKELLQFKFSSTFPSTTAFNLCYLFSTPNQNILHHLH